MRARWALASALVAVVVSVEANAGAGEPASPVGAAPPVVDAGEELGSPFHYTTPPNRHYFRAFVEDVAVLGLGYAQYASNKAGNEVDWDLAPDWSSVERKLTFGALTFDNNHFDTNWLTHPGAGFLYYSAARTNRLSIPVALLYTGVSSTLWEYFGELREHAAINDLIATPMTGLPLGETMLHLGAFFQRGSDAFGSTALSWMFGSFKNVHDAIDGLEPARGCAVERHLDDLGLCSDDGKSEAWHRFTLGASVGMTHQHDGVTQGDVRGFATSRIIELRGYGGPGNTHHFFSDGEVSELALRAGTAEGQIVDIGLEARAAPWGYASQDVIVDPEGQLRGYGVVAAFAFGAEYGRHDYDRDRVRRPTGDRIALVNAGPMLEERVHLSAWTLRARLDGYVDFAGVEAYAMPEERQTYGDIHLASVLRNEGYYHAYGATLRPALALENRAIDFGTDLRVDWFTMIASRDVEPISTDTRIQASDRRLVSHAWLGVHPARHLRLSVTGELQSREGRVGLSRAGRSEIGMHGGFEFLF